LTGERHLAPERLVGVFQALFEHYGAQHWWPAETPFEVMVGAVLTQNTAWSNVERALAQLMRRIPLTAEAILALDHEGLAEAIRPAGYFNVKARRLRAFCAAYAEHGELAALSRLDTATLRQRLLAIKGVGPETADDMLLYAFERPVFVVDAYTRRLFVRLGLLRGAEGYETIRHGVEQAVGPDTAVLNEYHALIVRHAKDVCRTRPRCAGCCLRQACKHAPAEPG
jgi:endonuclease-3 related protein